jgi:cytosine/adenosine deaminase-related metal-dependent hydrolase
MTAGPGSGQSSVVRRLPASELRGVERVAARWVIPVDQPPIEDGVVEIADGRIVEVRHRAGASDDATLDLGNAALLPALVNAHAHLEFSDLAQPIQPATPFTQWIRNLLAYRRERERPIGELVRDGLSEAARTGTGLVGEIAAGDWQLTEAAAALTASDFDGSAPTVVAFRELIGLLPEQAADQLELARRHIDECRALSGSDDNSARGGLTLRPALSPHAPYSVGPDLYHQLVDLARRESVPLCIHLAETPAELELLERGTGEFVEMLSGFGIWQPGLIPRDSRPMDYLELLATVDHALIAHGNYLSDEEIAWLGRHPNIATVFCPRTHAFFGHSEHPWRKLLAAGATVSLGTDGRSSNPDYSLWSELESLTQQGNVTNQHTLIELATLAGARALGAEADYGSLAPGKSATFSVFPLTTPQAMVILRELCG